MKTFVALVDFSDITRRVVEQGLQMARAFQGKLILLHVVPEEPAVVELGFASPTLFQPPSEKRIEADYNRLLDLRESFPEPGVEVVAQQLEHGSVEKVLEHCRGLECDLLVLGAHHHSALYQLFVGTFTSNVLKRTTCPVLVVPAPDEK